MIGCESKINARFPRGKRGSYEEDPVSYSGCCCYHLLCRMLQEQRENKKKKENEEADEDRDFCDHDYGN